MPGPIDKTGASSINIEKLTESDLPRTVISLAWPVVLEMTFFGLGSIINTILVGRLGASSLAAVGLGQQVEFIPQVIFTAVNVGTLAIVSRHIGAGEVQAANHTAGQSAILAVIFGLLFLVPMWLYAEQALELLRARPDVVVLGAKYIRSIVLSMIPALILTSGGAALRGAGNTKTPMIIMVVVTVFNIIFGYLLIYGGFGFPAMGVPGAGIAVSIARTIGALAVITILVRGSGLLKYQISSLLTIDFSEMRRIFRIGLPAGVEQIQLQGAMIIYTVLLSSLGTIVFAAHSVAMRIENLAFMPGFGFGIAAMTMVGQSLGAERPELGEKAAYLAQKYAAITMTVIGCFMFFFGRQIASLFISDPEVIRLATLYLQMWTLAMPMMGTSNALAGGLRGAGDTRWVLVIMTLSSWLVRLPIGFLLVMVFHLGPVGAWAAGIIDINVRGVFIWMRFATGKWKGIKI